MFKTIFFWMFFSVLIFISISSPANVKGIDTYEKPIKVNYHDLPKEIKIQILCLADNIYFEAVGEPYHSQKAVALVTINRVQSKNYGKDICATVHQKTNGVCQFSWYCDRQKLATRLTIRQTNMYNEILELAIYVLVNLHIVEDVTKGATYFHSEKINPRWKLHRVDKIGGHIFYKSNKDKIDRTVRII
jgi:spore germination cell wall hydrolase CwlJ-like protein